LIHNAVAAVLATSTRLMALVEHQPTLQDVLPQAASLRALRQVSVDLFGRPQFIVLDLDILQTITHAVFAVAIILALAAHPEPRIRPLDALAQDRVFDEFKVFGECGIVDLVGNCHRIAAVRRELRKLAPVAVELFLLQTLAIIKEYDFIILNLLRFSLRDTWMSGNGPSCIQDAEIELFCWLMKSSYQHQFHNNCNDK